MNSPTDNVRCRFDDPPDAVSRWSRYAKVTLSPSKPTNNDAGEQWLTLVETGVSPQSVLGGPSAPVAGSARLLVDPALRLSYKACLDKMLIEGKSPPDAQLLHDQEEDASVRE